MSKLKILLSSGEPTSHAVKALLAVGPASHGCQHTNFIIKDYSNTVYKTTESVLAEKHYNIKVLNLLNPKDHFNPFEYIQTDRDVLLFVDTILHYCAEPALEGVGKLLLCAATYYLLEAYPIEDRSMNKLVEIIKLPRNELTSVFDKHYAKNYSSNAAKIYQKTCRANDFEAVTELLYAKLLPFDLPFLTPETPQDTMDLRLLSDSGMVIFFVPSGITLIDDILYDLLIEQSKYQLSLSQE